MFSSKFHYQIDSDKQIAKISPTSGHDREVGGYPHPPLARQPDLAGHSRAAFQRHR
jgi:hypothetical protein